MPPLPRFNVYEVLPTAGKATAIHTGRALYVIEIPQSIRPPHQSLTGRYQTKAGSKSRALLHYEIVNLSQKGPLAEASVDIGIQPHQQIDSTLRVRIENTGSLLIRDLRLELLLPPEMPEIGCVSAKDAPMFYRDDIPWLKFVVSNISAPLFLEQREIFTWLLEFETGFTFHTKDGAVRLAPVNIGHYTLWYLPPE